MTYRADGTSASGAGEQLDPRRCRGLGGFAASRCSPIAGGRAREGARRTAARSRRALGCAVVHRGRIGLQRATRAPPDGRRHQVRRHRAQHHPRRMAGGAERIIAVDLNPEKPSWHWRTTLRCTTDTVDAAAGDPVATVLELTHGGVDAGDFERSYRRTLVAQAFQMIRTGCRLRRRRAGSRCDAKRDPLRLQLHRRTPRPPGSVHGRQRLQARHPDARQHVPRGRLELEGSSPPGATATKVNQDYEVMRRGYQEGPQRDRVLNCVRHSPRNAAARSRRRRRSSWASWPPITCVIVRARARRRRPAELVALVHDPLGESVASVAPSASCCASAAVAVSTSSSGTMRLTSPASASAAESTRFVSVSRASVAARCGGRGVRRRAVGRDAGGV